MKLQWIHDRSKGSSSIMVMLIMLVLVVFGVLALMSSYSDFKLSKKSAAWHATYYSLDAKGEELIARVDGMLKAAALGERDQSAYFAKAKAQLNKISSEYAIKMTETADGMDVHAVIQDENKNKLGVALRVMGLKAAEQQRRYKILEWKQLPKQFKYEGQSDLWNGEVDNP